MRFFLVPLFVLASFLIGISQIIDVKKATENAVIYRTNQSINNGINMGVNAIFNAPGKIYRKIKEKNQSGNNQQPSNYGNSILNNNVTSPLNSSGNLISGSDFVQGNTLVWTDNFSTNSTGKFPQQWSTNGSGEVRSVNDTNWLQISTNGMFMPQGIKQIPSNFKLEFDAIFNPNPSKDAHYILYLYSTKDKALDFKETNYPGKAGIYFAFNTHAGEIDSESFENGNIGLLDFHMVTDALKSSVSNQQHFGLSKETNKISLFLNGHMIFSSTNAIPDGYTFDAIKFGSFYMSEDDFMLISNLQITE